MLKCKNYLFENFILDKTFFYDTKHLLLKNNDILINESFYSPETNIIHNLAASDFLKLIINAQTLKLEIYN